MKDNYVVIGGTSGIGLSITESLVKSGNEVTTISRRPEGLKEVRHLSLDVTKDEIPSDAIADELRGIVYCPGTINLRPFRSLSLKDFEDDWRINVWGAFKTLKALIPKINRNGNGSILLFSTVAAQHGMPFHTSISAAKGAIEGFTRSLAAELAPAIRVNCIAPSLTDTPLAERIVSNDQRRKASADRHPLKRLGNPSDLAAMAHFLLTDHSAWITGQVIAVDGGLSTVRI